MSDPWSAVAAVAAVCAIVPACLALWWASKAVKAASEANTIAKSAAQDNRRLLQIEEANEHQRLTPQLDFVLGETLGGGGYELTLTVDRPVDSVSVALVRGVDHAADDTVMGVIDGMAPGPAGTLSSQVTLPAIPAGGTRRLSLWLSDHTRGSGAVVRLRSEARLGDRVWTDLIDDVTLPHWVAVT